MADIIRVTITFFLSNYSFTFFLIGLVVSLIAIMAWQGGITRALIVEKLLAWYVFFSIGVDNLYNFVMHVFFGEMSARFIGWADSPFQLEVGVASLGFAVVGFLAAFRSFDLRLAAIIGPSIFTLGAAVGHIQQMITAHNFAPGNAGLIFWTDIFVPVFGLVLLWLQHSYGKPAASAHEDAKASSASPHAPTSPAGGAR